MRRHDLARALAEYLGKSEPQLGLAESVERLRDSLEYEAFVLACSGFGVTDRELLGKIYEGRTRSAGPKASKPKNNDADKPMNQALDDEAARQWYLPFEEEPLEPAVGPSHAVSSEESTRIFSSSQLPPFLKNKTLHSSKPVSPVRDPESRMARAARTGSELVRFLKSQKERADQARKVAGIQKSVEPKQTRLLKSKPLSREQIMQQRQALPALASREGLLQCIRENQVVIVVGETGSGKTTQLPQFLVESGYTEHNQIIGCTQPRRVAAMSVAQRVSAEMDVNLGAEVGYTIRFENKTSSKTRIKFMTAGILLRESLNDALLEKYSCVIIDEAHERALDTDIILGLMKRVLARRKDIKLIVTSATLDARRFSAFFGGAPLFNIPGRTFDVHIRHLSTMPDDYVVASVRQVLSIHLQQGPGDILVFMTGKDDIEATCAEIRNKMALLDKPPPLDILPIYSQLPSHLQARIFLPAPPGTRKVIVATNIAETSLTVDGIRFVVDSGYAKLKVYKPKLGVDTLQLVPISRANASQRAGRAGRTSEGVCYCMYTKLAESEEMYEQTVPEIQRTNLSNTVLLLKSLNVDNVFDFDFLDPPESEAVSASLYELWALSALYAAGQLTDLGKKLANFPMDPYMARLIVAGVEHNCAADMISIAAMMSVPSVFQRSNERAKESDRARQRFLVADSDHLSLLNVFNQWRAHRTEEWAADNFLQPKSLSRAQDVRKQLESLVQSVLGARNLQSTPDLDILRRCVCAGFFHQAARTKGLQTYVGLRNNVVMRIHPTSALYGLGVLPEYVVYNELLVTSQQYMMLVTSVDPQWLLEDGRAFYYTEGNEIKEIGEPAIKKPRLKFTKSGNKAKPKFMRGV